MVAGRILRDDDGLGTGGSRQAVVPYRARPGRPPDRGSLAPEGPISVSVAIEAPLLKALGVMDVFRRRAQKTTDAASLLP